jgi:putative endonuclease
MNDAPSATPGPSRSAWSIFWRIPWRPVWRPAWLDTQQSILRHIAPLAQRRRRSLATPAHLATGLRGEEEALFHLRRLGYTVVARRWSTPLMPGDIDLVAWHDGHLCFIEVKSRTGRDLVPAEFAVDTAKQDTLRRLARIYRKRVQPLHAEPIPIRFDVVSVYFTPGAEPQIQPRVELEVFPGAFSQ